MSRNLIFIIVLVALVALIRQTPLPIKQISPPNSLAIPNDIGLLVKGPPHDAPDAYKKDFLNAVIKNSVPADSIDVTNCQPQPIIAQLKLNSDLTIKNNGDNQVVLELTQAHGDPKYIYYFDKKTAGVIKTAFDKGSGAYAYYCNHSKDPVGVFYLN